MHVNYQYYDGLIILKSCGSYAREASKVNEKEQAAEKVRASVRLKESDGRLCVCGHLV